jgi:hypothetical protein
MSARGVAIPLIIVGLLTSCGGRDIPLHTGYKSEKSKPWKKAKGIAFNEKFEAKIDGDLNYSEYKRARWYALQVPASGDLNLTLEVTPGAEIEDLDMAMEVFDTSNRVIAKADSEDEDTKETTKKRTVALPTAGRYLIQVYLQGRMDIGEFELQVAFAPRPGELKTDFPASVAFVGDLPQVPLTDDTPADRKVKVAGRKPRPTEPRKPKEPKVVATAPTTNTTVGGAVMKVVIAGDGTEITFTRGTGVETGMSGRVVGLSSGGFTVGACSDRSCKAVVKATPDQIGAGKVAINVPAPK